MPTFSETTRVTNWTGASGTFMALVLAGGLFFPSALFAKEDVNALIAKVRGAPDAFTLKCEGTNDDFYFTVSASFDAVVWSGGKNIEQRSIFADGKDTGLGSKAKVRVEPNVISWNVKTAYGRDFGTIDRKKLTLDMHATIDGDDIFNVGPCTQN